MPVAGSSEVSWVCVILKFELLPLPDEAVSLKQRLLAHAMNSKVKGERSMRTKSLLLSLFWIISGLMLGSFPANAACWAFPQSPCPDTTASVPAATDTNEATAASKPSAALEKPAPAKKSATTAKIKPPSSASAPAKTNPAPVPTEITATPPDAPAQAKSAPHPPTVPVRAEAVPAAGPAPAPIQDTTAAPAPASSQPPVVPLPPSQPAQTKATVPPPAPTPTPEFGSGRDGGSNGTASDSGTNCGSDPTPCARHGDNAGDTRIRTGTACDRTPEFGGLWAVCKI